MSHEKQFIEGIFIRMYAYKIKYEVHESVFKFNNHTNCFIAEI